MKSRYWYQALWAITGMGCVALASAQGIPADQWTEQERQFVQNARNLFQQQGLIYGDEQAASAVQQMRQKAQSTAVPAGIPEKEWTHQEREYVKAVREQYQASGMALTQEQAQVMVQSMRNKLAQLMGSVGALQAASQLRGQPISPVSVPGSTGGAAVASAQNAALTEEQITQTLAAWPAKPEQLSFSARKDGFDINGQPVLDPEGRISSYATDAVGGAVTYMVQSSRGMSVKSLSAADPSRKLVLATGRQGPNGWEVVTSTGQQLSGQTLSVLSDGFLVGRETAAFRYKAGQGVSNIAIPSGYFLAPLQRGHVGATGFVLLEKEGATGTDSLSKLAANLQSIGTILGTNRTDDFALMDIQTRKLYPLNISATGKNVNVHSQCRRKNSFVNECAQMQSFEALYNAQGMKNSQHYYWLVHWLNTPAGPVALTLEDGQANLYLTDLRTGRKVVALNRTLGIADWDAIQNSDGTVALRGKLAFEWKEIPDVASLLQGAQ